MSPAAAPARGVWTAGPGACAAVLLLVAVLLAACSEPELAVPEQQGQAEPDPPEAEVDDPDPARDRLVERIEVLSAAVTGVRELLAPALEADDPQVARSSAEAAFAAFVGDEDGATVFPGQLGEVEREAGDDALQATLAEARDAGGELGSATVEVLRDPVAGDLGAWERDPAGMLEGILAAVDGVEDADTAGRRIGELDGEGSRVIAWLALARDTADDRLALEAVERADGHLEAILLAVDLLRDEPADASDDDADAAEPDG